MKEEATFRINSDFTFFLDIPAYHGMSGGPIFYTQSPQGKADEIHVFGVTNRIGKKGENRLMTRGAFIRPELFQSIHSRTPPSNPPITQDLLSDPIPFSSSSNAALTPFAFEGGKMEGIKQKAEEKKDSFVFEFEE